MYICAYTVAALEVSKVALEDTKQREPRDARFTRLAEKRVNVVLDRLRLLGQLSDKRNYNYTDAQVAKIFRAIDQELKSTRSKFENGSTERTRFTL